MLPGGQYDGRLRLPLPKMAMPRVAWDREVAIGCIHIYQQMVMPGVFNLRTRWRDPDAIETKHDFYRTRHHFAMVG